MKFSSHLVSKSSLIALVLTLSASFASAADAPNVYRATNEYQNTGSQEFNTVEAEGIRAGAMAQAFQKCLDAGNRLCSLSSIQLISSNVLADGLRHVSYEALVQALDRKNIVPGPSFASTRATWNVRDIPYLNSMASQAMAIETAQSQCFASGATLCVLSSTSFVETDAFHTDDSRYHTTAQATVQAYTLR